MKQCVRNSNTNLSFFFTFYPNPLHSSFTQIFVYQKKETLRNCNHLVKIVTRNVLFGSSWRHSRTDDISDLFKKKLNRSNSLLFMI